MRRLLALIVGITFTAECVQGASLRFDGLYCHPDQSRLFTEYLRFYPDGVVLSTSSTGTPRQVTRWLRRESTIAEHERFVITHRKVQIWNPKWGKDIGYVGTVGPSFLLLHYYQLWVDETPLRFTFVRLNFTK